MTALPPPESFGPLPSAVLQQQRNGSWRATYMNRMAESDDKMRLMAWLQVIYYEEQGMLSQDAQDQANSAFPCKKGCSMRVSWAVQPRVES
jgi:hypothetical protein